MNDLSGIAITACAGCGRGPDQVELKKLRTYSRSFACVECVVKYSACSQPGCQHEKHIHRVCQHCGCAEYRHGLEGEFDRQLADVVGQKPRINYCQGLGGRPCGAIILAGPDGRVGRLCTAHQAEWERDVWATLQDMRKTLTKEAAH